MVALKMAFHSLTGRRIVEVYDNRGEFIASIYPDEANNGVKIVSKYFDKARLDEGETSIPPIPAVSVTFKRGE